MTDSQATSTTADDNGAPQSSSLDLTCLPPLYVLSTHLSIDEQHEAEELLRSCGAPLTYDIQEARVVLGNISRTQRARLELKWKGLQLEDSQITNNDKPNPTPSSGGVTPAKKKRKVARDEDIETAHTVTTVGEDSSAASKPADEAGTDTKPMSQLSISGMPPSSSASKLTVDKTFLPGVLPDFLPDTLIVVRLEWLNAAVSANELISMEPFIILNVRILPLQELKNCPDTHLSSVEISSIKQTGVDLVGSDSRHHDSRSIMERAKADPKPKPVFSRYKRRDGIAEAANPDIVGKSFSSSQVPRLLHQTTSEDEEIKGSALPPMPDWVLQNKIYSCERSTPLDSPNSNFIKFLKLIRTARELTLDEIGVRAYSTSIASVSAYPYGLQSSREVLALPGCDTKIAHLFHEYHTTGQLQAVLDIEASPALTSLRTFHEIWGVGAVTAREFYYEKGWRDLDDIIEYGWKMLTRVQQIGLKYFDEFQAKLTRAEVEAIADTITRHAALITDTNIQTAIVGGYRRRQPLSSDVDIILSHPDESQTINLVTKIVTSLESEGWITHTLTLNLTTTHRKQATLPIHPMKGGHGFDTLDKALVVWQSPDWPTRVADLATDPKAKNPNPHHRVDIIISPWRTVGCAVAGWTSGTTFQRDLRRYCKHTKGWKFDSSGVRQRGTGAWVDLEGWRDERTRCRTWEEAERKVFGGLGLVWREPWERCTG